MPVNYFHRRDPTGRLLVLLWMTVWAAIAGVVAYSLIRQQRRPADYGFSFKTGGALSLAMLAAVHVYLAISGKLVLSAKENFLLSAVGAFMEELIFRAIMDGIEAKALWAILASSVLFSAPHLLFKSPGMLGGLFISSLVMGYVYYQSRSILLPAWIHGVANAGYLGGIWIAAFYCVISFADCAIWSWNKQTPPVADASRNI